MSKNLNTIIQGSLAEFTPKQRKVLVDRFGLQTGRRATLQSIGDKLGVTRERVRQIEEQALNKLKPIIQERAKSILELGRTHLAKVGGVRRDDDFVSDFRYFLNDDQLRYFDRKLRFLFVIAGSPFYHREDDDFYSFWYLKEGDKKNLLDLIKKTVRFFESKDKKSILKDKIYLDQTKDTSSLYALSISKRFGVNTFGDFGLSDWPEIKPKNIRDKIYLALHKENQPLHFENIAKCINKHAFDSKQAYPQTVHNELIKDDRFILVGRGIYGLKEYGYEPGTVREVIARLLKEKGPLVSSEVVELVNENRIFKKQTILLNLQNRKHFKRLNNGQYTIHNA